ncbi:MAG: hypothetical protein K2W96_15910 [Gemmataceae bacterium]|nr:hypothetical protein [Gemmataceae bacterium]
MDAESREEQGAQAVTAALPLLVAYRDDRLSDEAAEQLARMAEDPSLPTHKGEDLPLADKAALLRKARATQTKG